jgi:integrase
MKQNQLTARGLASLKEPGHYGDGAGLWLQISKTGTKSWVFRFVLDGRVREMGLGSCATFTIKEARERARYCRQLLVDGIDPIEERKAKRDAKRAAEAKRISFAEATERYITAHAVKWTNAKHAAQWRSSVEQYAHPVMGKLPVDAIDLQHVLKVLEPIWLSKHETASRLRGRIEKVLSWATVRKFRHGENPARWSGHLSEMLPELKNGKQHHAALAINDLPGFMRQLRAIDGVTARAVEFTALTAARTGEVNGAVWDEIEGSVWTVPGNRMKARKPHRVPLSGRALEILTEMRGHGGTYIFPGVQSQWLRHSAMLELLKTMRPGLTMHGLRSTFSDWARDRTAYARDVIELCLARIIGGESEARLSARGGP